MSLDEEMDFVKSYIYQEKIRFDGNLAVDINQAPGFGTRQVIPASIQILVENALKRQFDELFCKFSPA